MAVDQRDLAGTRPVPARVDVHAGDGEPRDGHVRVWARGVRRAHPGDVVSGPDTGGTGDVSTTVVGPAFDCKSETVRLECEIGGRSVVGCRRDEDSA